VDYFFHSTPDMLKYQSPRNHLFLSLQLLLMCGLFLVFGTGFAAQVESSHVVDASQIGQESLSLTPYFAVLEDPSLGLTLADIRRPDLAIRFHGGQLPASALNFGFTHSAYWLRLTLRNPGDENLERMLEIAYARLSSVEFYQPVADGSYQSWLTGRVVPFASRPYKNRNFIFPVSLPAHSEQTVYLRIQSTDSILIPARLWEPRSFHRDERNDYIGQAWYFGIASAMILFNLLLFIELKDRVYFLYVAFVMGSAITIAAQNGLAQEFLWPEATLLSNISTFAGVSLSLAALILFMRSMLNTRRFIPGIDGLLKFMAIVHLLTPLGYAISLQTFARYAAVLNLATALLILGTGIYCALKRQRTAYFFVAAFTTIVVGGVMTAMRSFGYLPTNVITMNGLQFGSAVEMLLLAFTLADRFNEIRREKTKAQNELLQTQQRLLESLKSSERELEARVAERTNDLQVLNAKLSELSMTDGLTGISNRRKFDEVLGSEWNRAARKGQTLSLAMLDVDFFKKYNDHYGHLAGDECLRRIASVLANNICRTGDLVARYGGEEFVFIAPSTDGNSALKMSQKILEVVHTLAIPHELSNFHCVTVSIGVANMVPRAGEPPQDLVKKADEALYLAKQQGRNRAVLF
jgi:two-component system, sensor histidine kinase LadS